MRTKAALALSVASTITMGTILAGCAAPTLKACPAPTPSAGGDPALRRGPDPTAASVSAEAGPFAIATAPITGMTGFAGGTVYHPTEAGTWGGIVLAPPYMVNSSATAPMAKRLASHGFVVLSFDANSTSDTPPQRAVQAKAAFDFLITKSSVAGRVDRNRLAIGGYSMGGGATLEVARDVPALKAALPMVPWDSTKDFSTVTVPTMILAAENDNVAGVADHARPFFNSLAPTLSKGYVEVKGAGHFMPTTPPPSMVRYSVSWMKRWVDGDTRYSQFLGEATADLSAFKICGAI